MEVEIDNYKYELLHIPRKCPICHYEAEPNLKSGTVINYHKIDVAFHCTNCHHMFIGKYMKDNNEKYKLVDTWPKTLQSVNFEIKDISPTFVRLYEESICAYDSDLKQLSGIGFKKALETLLKDYLIRNDSDNRETIKDYSLLECLKVFNLNNEIDMAAIEKCSQKQSNYEVNFEDKDILRIKTLINTISNSIRNKILEEDNK
jgi:hypothetical protein